MLGSVTRNIQTKMSDVRKAAYTTLVRQQLEYAAGIWDPHHQDKTSQIVKIQRRAARWTTCNFDSTASVSGIIEDLMFCATKETEGEVVSVKVI